MGDMVVNLWGESPLYLNPVNVFSILTKVLADGKSKIPLSGTNQCLKKQDLVSVKELWANIYPPQADSLPD